MGVPIDGALESFMEPSDLAALHPIDDVRASARYRSEAALVLTSRALRRLRDPSA